MSLFTQRIFSRGRFLFWGIVPVGGALLVSMNVFRPTENIWMLWVLDVVFVLLAFGLWNRTKLRTMLRIVCGIVSVGYLALTIEAYVTGEQRLRFSVGLLAIGIPAAIFAIRGYFMQSEGVTGEWIEAVNQTRDGLVLRRALTGVVENSEPPSTGRCLRALIAAELIATRKGYDPANLPLPLREWPQRHSGLEVAHLIPLAVQALDRIAAKSELRELWMEKGEASAFEAEVRLPQRYLV